MPTYVKPGSTHAHIFEISKTRVLAGIYTPVSFKGMDKSRMEISSTEYWRTSIQHYLLFIGMAVSNGNYISEIQTAHVLHVVSKLKFKPPIPDEDNKTFFSLPAWDPWTRDYRKICGTNDRHRCTPPFYITRDDFKCKRVSDIDRA